MHGLIGNLLAAADAARSAITGALQSMHLVAASFYASSKFTSAVHCHSAAGTALLSAPPQPHTCTSSTGNTQALCKCAGHRAREEADVPALLEARLFA